MTIEIRPAAAPDVERIAEIVHGQPMHESVAMCGGVDAARRFGRGLVELDRIPNDAKPTVVAEDADRIVGVLQYTNGTGSGAITFGHVRLAVSACGAIGVVRMLPLLRARAKVEIPIPPGSFYIAELHVDPELRGQGVGGQLLDWADTEAARSRITHLTLTTTIDNPARRLYGRHGYAVTRTATDPRFERLVGIPGRVLMEKHLGG